MKYHTLSYQDLKEKRGSIIKRLKIYQASASVIERLPDVWADFVEIKTAFQVMLDNQDRKKGSDKQKKIVSDLIAVILDNTKKYGNKRIVIRALEEIEAVMGMDEIKVIDYNSSVLTDLTPMLQSEEPYYPPARNRCCDNCRFSFMHNEHQGECRFYPPKADVIDITPRDWCGQWEWDGDDFEERHDFDIRVEDEGNEDSDDDP